MPLTPETGHLMTATQVARRLQVSTKTVRRLADTGVLPFVSLGPTLRRYRPDDVDQLTTSQRSAQPR